SIFLSICKLNDGKNDILENMAINENYQINDLNEPSKRSIKINRNLNWTLPIPYFVDKQLNDKTIIKVLNYISKYTCVTFQKIDSLNLTLKPLYFNKSSECESTVGRSRLENYTEIKLTKECSEDFGELAIDVSSILGLHHEHQRVDRDQYIKINFTNVPRGYASQISTKDGRRIYITFNSSYDYGSIMHFPSVLDGKEVMVSRKSSLYNKMMGQRKGLSFNDFRLINYYYCLKNCPEYEIECKNGGYKDWKTCTRCICPKGYRDWNCKYIDRHFSYCGSSELISTNKVTRLQVNGIKKCNYEIKSKIGTNIIINIISVKTKEKEICSQGFGFEIKYLKDKATSGLCLCGTYSYIYIVS
uniref:Metalloendopeptidase n=1 Tax=Parastrongyloides trichosuri TaxID=131310 RepID=A0A0N4ZZB7_PARTI